jgi:chromosome segregation ATPase
MAPKQKQRDESKAALEETEATIQSKRNKLKQITDKLEELEDQYRLYQIMNKKTSSLRLYNVKSDFETCLSGLQR